MGNVQVGGKRGGRRGRERAGATGWGTARTQHATCLGTGSARLMARQCSGTSWSPAWRVTTPLTLQSLKHRTLTWRRRGRPLGAQPSSCQVTSPAYRASQQVLLGQEVRSGGIDPPPEYRSSYSRLPILLSPAPTIQNTKHSCRKEVPRPELGRPCSTSCSSALESPSWTACVPSAWTRFHMVAAGSTLRQSTARHIRDFPSFLLSPAPTTKHSCTNFAVRRRTFLVMYRGKGKDGPEKDVRSGPPGWQAPHPPRPELGRPCGTSCSSALESPSWTACVCAFFLVEECMRTIAIAAR
eukprot:scaffold5458_cov131-Isochrysis_galbana.AAC.2